LSSFLLALLNDELIGAVSAWIEGLDGIPSTIIKGNLLSYILPKSSLQNAAIHKDMISEIHIGCIPYSIQIGLVYVSNKFRGLNIAGKLIEEKIKSISLLGNITKEAYIQVFDNNISAVRAYEKINFSKYIIKHSPNPDIENFLPSRTRILMKKQLY